MQFGRSWRSALRLLVMCALLANGGMAAADPELNRQGMAALQKGDMRQAVTLFEQAVQSFTRTVGERHPDTLTSMSNLANGYREVGRTAEALTLIERVLRLRTEILGERHQDTLISMNSLAVAYSALGRHAEALSLNEKVLRLGTEILGERHRSMLTWMNNLAFTYRDLGRIAEALALDEKVLRLRTETLGERHPDTLSSMNNLADTYRQVGRTSEALSLIEKTLRLRTEVLGERHPSTLRAMTGLAVTYGLLGRTAEALTLNEKIVRLRTEILGERHPETLTSMGNLAESYRALGRTSEALDLNEKTLRLRTDILGERHPSTLVSMNNLALIYRALRRTADEVAVNEKLVRLRSEILGERHPHTLTSLWNTAASYLSARRPADAAKLSVPFVAGAEWQRSQPGLSGENRRSLFEGFASGYRLFSTVHGSLGQLPEGFRLTELGKARTLLEAIVAQRAGRSGVLPEAEQARLDDLNRQAAAIDQRIAQAATSEARGVLEASRNDLARQYAELQLQFKTRYPKYAQLSDVRILGAADLPGLVEADAVAVSYVYYKVGNVLGAFVVDGTGLQRYVALGSVPYLAEAVEIVRLGQSVAVPLASILAAEGKRAWRLADGSLRVLPLAQEAPANAREVASLAEVAQFLASRLLQPLAKDLAGKPRWLISPDGPLAQLTFETLPFGEKGEPALLAAQIQYTQSLSVYALGRSLQRQYASLDGRQGLFAMGNPQYRPADLNPPERRSLRSAALGSGTRLSDLDPLWIQLPGTETEVKGVAELFPGSATVLLGAQATEQNLQAINARGGLKNYRHLLFSAHGFLSPDEPALSAIVLGLQSKTPEADGYVTAAEWPSYDLRSDLTVLSACDTGVGRLVSGEGVMGLPFALFVAGNVNTILTLWPVDDEGTAKFVRDLFERIKQGRSASQALAETKRAFAKHPRLNHPRYWAPFVLVGAG